MKTRNYVLLVGYQCAAAEIRQRKNGNLMALFQLATDYYVDSPDAVTVKKTNWHNIVVFDEETIVKLQTYYTAGSHLMIEGTLVYSYYLNKAGYQHVRVEIRASVITDLDR